MGYSSTTASNRNNTGNAIRIAIGNGKKGAKKDHDLGLAESIDTDTRTINVLFALFQLQQMIELYWIGIHTFERLFSCSASQQNRNRRREINNLYDTKIRYRNPDLYRLNGIIFFLFVVSVNAIQYRFELYGFSIYNGGRVFYRRCLMQLFVHPGDFATRSNKIHLKFHCQSESHWNFDLLTSNIQQAKIIVDIIPPFRLRIHLRWYLPPYRVAKAGTCRQKRLSLTYLHKVLNTFQQHSIHVAAAAIDASLDLNSKCTQSVSRYQFVLLLYEFKWVLASYVPIRAVLLKFAFNQVFVNFVSLSTYAFVYSLCTQSFVT